MDSSRKTLLFFGISLLLVSSASAATLQVEGLTAENVNATFVNSSTIRFTTSYLNKSLTPKQVFVPNATSHAVVDWSFSRKTWDGNNGVSSLNYQYGLASNYEYPSPETSALLGQNSSVAGLPANYYDYSDSFYSNESTSRGTVFQSSFSEVVEDSQNQPIGNATWNITVKAHYEHLIINYELIYNDTVQDQFQDVYSGSETLRIPVYGSVHRINRTTYEQRIKIDNRYEKQEYKQIVVAYPEKSSVRRVETDINIQVENKCDIAYSKVENQLDKANMSSQFYIDKASNYQFSCYNVSVARDSSPLLKVYFKEPVLNNINKKIRGSYYSYIIGSVATFKTNTSSEWSNGNLKYTNINSGKLELMNRGYDVVINSPSNGMSLYQMEDGSLKSVNFDNTFGSIHDVDNDKYLEGFWYTGSNKIIRYGDSKHGVEGELKAAYGITDIGGVGKFDSDSDYDVGFQGTNTGWARYVDFNNNTNGIDENSEEVGAMQDADNDGDLDQFFTPDGSTNYLKYKDAAGNKNTKSTDDLADMGGFGNWDGDSTTAYAFVDGQGGLYVRDSSATSELDTGTSLNAGDIIDWNNDGDADLFYTTGGEWLLRYDSSIGIVNHSVQAYQAFQEAGDIDADGDTKSYGYYSSQVYTASEKKIWDNITISNFDKNSGNITIWIKTSNDGSPSTSPLETDKISSSELPSSGTTTIDLSFTKGATDVKYNITLKASSPSPTIDSISIDGKTANKEPQIQTSKIKVNKSSKHKRLVFGLDPVGDPDISDYSGLSSALKFTNTTLKSSISFPFTSTVNVSDWKGAFSNDKAVDLSKTDSGIQEEDFDHSEDTQRLNRTYAISNNAASPINYTLQLDLPGTVIQGQLWTGTISSSSSVAHTAITEGDWITEAVSKLRQDKSSTSDLGTQYVYKAKNLTETQGIKFTGVNVSAVSIPGTCSNCGKRNVDVPASSTITEYYNSTGDWIVNETRGTFILGVNTSFHHTLDKQKLFNQTNLTVSNTRGFTFQQVNLSSICSLDTKADVPAGTSQITTKCSNETVSGDWIVHEENYTTEYRSGEIVIGSNIKQNYTAVQKIYAENNRSSHGFSVDYASKISSRQKCSLMNQTVQTLSASSAANKSFYKNCEPGEEVSWDRTKTDTGDYYKYNYTAQFKVFTEITSENTTLYGIPINRLPNWGERDPDKTKIKVDGSSKDLKVLDKTYHGTEYKVIRIGRNHTESSVHEGTHTASLVYYEPKETDTGSTGGGGGGGTTKVVKKVVNESESGFKWTLSVLNGEGNEVGNTISLLIGPGEEVNYTMVVANTGSRNVTLTIDCVSQDGVCSWIDTSVDRIKLDPTGFNKTSFRVTGEVPENVSGGKTYNFRIQVTDPSFQPGKPGGAAVVSFKLSTNKLGALFTRLTDKLDDTFTVEPPFGQGKKISGVPIVFVSMLAGIGVFAALAAVASAVATGKEMRSVGIIVSFVVAVSVFITVTLGI